MDQGSSKLRVFISFSDGDRELAKVIQKAIEKRSDVDVFLDESIPTGGKWESVIRDEIQQSDVFLALLSNHYLDSHHCYNIEATDAYKLHVVSPHGSPEFFPVVLEELAPIRYEKTCFSEFQYFPRNNQFYKHLSNELDRVEFVRDLAVEFDKFIHASLSVLKHPANPVSTLDPNIHGPLAHSVLVQPQGVFEAYDPFLESFFSIDPALSSLQAVTAILNKIVAQLNGDCAYIKSEGGENITEKTIRSTDDRVTLSTFQIHEQLKRKIQQPHELRKPVYLKNFVAALEPGRKDVLIIPVFPCEGVLLVITGNNLSENVVDQYICDVASAGLAYFLSPEKIETNSLNDHIIDSIKDKYGYVSDSVYFKRFSSFKKEVKSLTCHFEKIVKLRRLPEDGLQADIVGWEALARRKEDEKSPPDLFNAAERWGVEFQTELDLHMVKESIQQYKQAFERLRIFRVSERPPLFLNVYPKTIERQAFPELIHDCIKKGLIRGDNIVLEISEKTITSYSGSAYETRHDLERFSEMISKLKHRFELRFALDDFGVGNSSLSRYYRLRPDFIKIDREVLVDYSEEQAKLLIDYFTHLKLTKTGLLTEVIVEGLDEFSNVKLKDLLKDEHRQRLIQGFRFGLGSQKVESDISGDLYEGLKAEII